METALGKIYCHGMQCSLMVQSSYTPHTLKEMLGWIEIHLCIDISDDTFPTSTLASQTTSTVEVHVHIGGSLCLVLNFILVGIDPEWS